MKTFASGFVKLIVSYFALLFVIMLLPVLLITTDVPELDSVMDYLFT